MPVPLTFEFHLDPRETVRVSRYIERRQRFGWLYRGLSPMLVILATVHVAGGGRVGELWLVGLMGVFFGVMRFVGPLVQRRRYRKLYAETPGLSAPQVYRFSQDGVTMSSGPAAITLAWDAVVEADESADAFLLFFNKQCAYFLPKRVVPAPVEQELRTLLRRSLGDRAQRLRG